MGEGSEKRKRWGKKAKRTTFASLSQHSFQGWDWVPLDEERSLVLSFPEPPPLCRTVPLPPLPPPPLMLPQPSLPLPLPPPSATRSFSGHSDPLSERREF